MAMPANTKEDFWKHVTKNGECLEFGNRLASGYGRFFIEGKTIKAHRFSWEINFGKIPNGMLVCHRCDNPPCVNPEHLFLGTPLSNMIDKSDKGRGYRPAGSKHHMVKLADSDVLKIRSRYASGEISMRNLGREFGVSASMVHLIVNRVRWTHI